MFKLSAVTPERVVFEQDAASIVAPGMLGYLGILTDHAPLITPLIPGRLQVRDSDGSEFEYFISGGFLEVSNNVATIAEDRARERLQHRMDSNIDTDRAEIALKRALMRKKMVRM